MPSTFNNYAHLERLYCRPIYAPFVGCYEGRLYKHIALRLARFLAGLFSPPTKQASTCFIHSTVHETRQSLHFNVPTTIILKVLIHARIFMRTLTNILETTIHCQFPRLEQYNSDKYFLYGSYFWCVLKYEFTIQNSDYNRKNSKPLLQVLCLSTHV
jgi:hypothetical protein